MSTVDRRRSGGGKQRGKATIVNKERRERDDTPQQQQQQQQQQQPQPTAQSSSSALSTSSVEELRAALSAVPSQTGYLILDHQATTLASSGVLASTSASAPLFHRLLLDVRGLLDHTPDRGREPLQSVTLDYVIYRYTITVTPHFILAIHVSQRAAAGTHSTANVGEEEDNAHEEKA